MIRRGIGVQSFVSAGGGTDADAQAVITAIESTGVTLTATQKTACNTLVTDLKGYGIWSKMKAVYGFLGGTAGAHKWNWKNPADTDAAFRLVFTGGMTHSSTGVLFGGVNGYADTKLLPSTLIQNNTHHSIYSRTNNNSEVVDIGSAVGTSIDPRFSLNIRYGAGNILATDMYDSSTARVSATNTDSRGFYLGTRTASNVFKGFKNNNQFGTTNTGAAGVLSNITRAVYIGALNWTSTIGYSNREYVFASIGDGLTDTEAANLYTAVQAYQTTLNRNI